MRRGLVLIGVLVGLAFLAVAGLAGTITATTPVQASANSSPFASCTADAGQVGTSFPNTEVEPWVDVNPANAKNIVAAWQQDRWSNGGSRGLVAGVSKNGGKTWSQVVIPKLTACSGSAVWKRASDPWVSFAPNGDLYHLSLSTTGGITFENGFPDSGILVSKSTNGGSGWSDPITLKADQGPNTLNDKQSITADPNDSNFVYAVWDRIQNANEAAQPVEVFQNAIGFHGPTWFSRTTNGGASWEPARMIFDPGGVNQTIGNVVAILPNGDLLDFFDLISNFKNAGGVRGFNVGFIRSSDQGATWSSSAQIVDKLFRVTVRDPDTGQALRTGDFNPEVAVDPASGTIYVVWQDARFSGGTRSDIAFTMSSDGGQSWTPTVKINTGSAGTSAFLPVVHVGADGSVGVVFYDLRNNTSDPATLPTDVWLTHCHTSCSNPANWTEAHVAGPFNYENAPNAGGFFLGDYVGLSATPDAFAALFTEAGTTASSADALYSSIGP